MKEKRQQVDAICRSLKKQHGNDNLKGKPHISLYGEEKAFAKPALALAEICTPLQLPQLLVLPTHLHFHLQIKEIASHSLHEVWYYLTAFFFPDQCAQLLVFKVP